MPDAGLYNADHRAQDLLHEVYTAVEAAFGPPSCGEWCERATPVTTYTEAMYLRDRSHLLAPGAKRAIIRRSRAWLLEETGAATRTAFLQPVADPVRVRAEVRELRGKPCPFRNGGTCLLAPLQPLECRLAAVPQRAHGAVMARMDEIGRVLPQRTGFLPSQLFAVFRLEELTAMVAQRRVPDAKVAVGHIGNLAVAQHAS